MERGKERVDTEMKNRHYLDWVREQPCVICQNDTGCDPHHPIGVNGTGETGGKAASDYEAFPLCHIDNGDRHSHSALHQYGHETWESLYGPQSQHTVNTLLRAIYQGRLVNRNAV